MTTKKRMQGLKEVPDDVKAEGYIRISTLKKGTKLLVETVARIYECVIIKKNTAIVQCSWPGMEGKVECKIVGSVSGDGIPFADLLLKEHHMMLMTPDGKHTTGRCLGITIRGTNEETGKSWVYDIWK